MNLISQSDYDDINQSIPECEQAIQLCGNLLLLFSKKKYMYQLKLVSVLSEPLTLTNALSDTSFEFLISSLG